MENREYSLAEAISKAKSYCARAEHCAEDVRQKCYQWGICSDEIEQIVDSLRESGYIDDSRYCHAFVHDKLHFQHWGKRKIRYALQQLHLPSDAIYDAMQEIDDDEYMRILEHVAGQKKSATREQQIRFLLQRGFDYDDITSVLP